MNNMIFKVRPMDHTKLTLYENNIPIKIDTLNYLVSNISDQAKRLIDILLIKIIDSCINDLNEQFHFNEVKIKWNPHECLFDLLTTAKRFPYIIPYLFHRKIRKPELKVFP